MLTQIDYLTPEKSDELVAKVKNPKHKVLILLMNTPAIDCQIFQDGRVNALTVFLPISMVYASVAV